MRSLFVMDPLSAIHIEGDSTYVTMRACSDRGFDVWMCTPDELYARDGRAFARATPVRTTASAPHFHPSEPVDLALAELDVVWMRKDPPFDMSYIFATYLLDMAVPHTLVVNGPAGLKLFNEKMWVAQRWPELQPPTLISNDMERLRGFASERGGRIVLKPWDGNGGRGVMITSATDRNLRSMVETLTAGGVHYVIAQDYVEAVERGDKRILLFDGEPVGAINRIPTAGDYRANMHVGARVEAVDLDASDLQICEALRPSLVEWGMVFVGIDVIGGILTEINVTSPTGIREINSLYGLALEEDLVDRVLAHVHARRSSA